MASPDQSTTSPTSGESPDGRPDFLVTLGLLIPVTEEEVKQAYRDKVKLVHPDHGGTQQQFVALQEAFERATEYARFFAGRRRWLAQSVERYVEQGETIEWINALGGKVELFHNAWLAAEIGDDFAQVLDQLVGIRLTGPKIGDNHIDSLLECRAVLTALHRVDFSDSRITDYGLTRLCALTSIRRINIARTPVTFSGLRSVEGLPKLDSLDITGVRLGWWGKYRLRKRLAGVEIIG